MQTFYVTYGFGTNLANKYSVIEACDYATARARIFKEIQGKFAFMYDESEFAGQVEEFNLDEVSLQAQVFLE